MGNRIGLTIQRLQQPGAYWRDLAGLGGLSSLYLVFPTIHGTYLADLGDAPDSEQVNDDARDQWERIAAQIVNALHTRSGGSLLLIRLLKPSGWQQLRAKFASGVEPESNWHVSASEAISPEMVSSCISHSWGRMMWTAIPEHQAVRSGRSMKSPDVHRLLSDQTWWVAPGHEDPYLLVSTADGQLLPSVVENTLEGLAAEFLPDAADPQMLRKFMVV